jgi:hypothetical protein
MDEIDIKPEFIGLFYDELLCIENKKMEKNKKIIKDNNKIKNEYNKIKVNEKEMLILKEIINLLCDKNK